MEENEQINQLKSDYELKISNLKNVLSKAKLAYDQQKASFLEKVNNYFYLNFPEIRFIFSVLN